MQSSPSLGHGALRHLMPCLALACLAAALPAAAQQVYRIVGPDGKVTFSDRPAQSAQQQAAPAAQAVAGARTATQACPMRCARLRAAFQ